MISVLLIWIFMAVTVYPAGTAVIAVLKKCCGSRYEVRHNDAVMMAGLAAVTVYAEFWSLAGGVGLAADLVLLIFCAAAVTVMRRQLGTEFMKIGNSLTGAKIAWYAVLILLFAYGTSRGYMHYDSDLYHAQAIRWIETYGIVPGLGNLHTRLAYNSAAFPLTALYSFAYLGGQSYHVCAGFMALILAKACGEALRDAQPGRRPVLSDFVRIAAVYYLFGIFREMLSPESDFFMAISAFYIFVRWSELAGRKEEDIFPYMCLSVFTVWTVTVKLSAAFLIMLALLPVFRAVRGRERRTLGCGLTAGVITAVPYLIRNIMISGWLLYPSTAIDICRADWKIPKITADSDAYQIRMWGRGYTDAEQYAGSGGHWAAVWFGGLGMSEKIMVMAAAAAVVILTGMTVAALIRHRREETAYLAAAWTASGTFIFWLAASPLIRYGIVFVMLTDAMVYGRIIRRAAGGDSPADRPEDGSVRGRRMRCTAKIVFAVFTLMIAYKTCILVKDAVGGPLKEYWVCQQDYGRYDTEAHRIDTITVYMPVSGDRTGYYAFPSAPYPTDIRMRGGSIRDGFRIR